MAPTHGPTAEAAAARTLQATSWLLWALVVPVLLLLGVLSALQYRQRMEDAERDLLRRATEHAQELEAVARPAMAHVQDLQAWLEANWAEPPDAGPALRNALVLRHDPDGQPDGWALDGASLPLRERFGQVLWAPPDHRPPEPAFLRRAHAFVEQARIVQQRAQGFEAAWFAAADVNASFGYPFVDTPRMLDAMGVDSLRAMDERRISSFERAARELAADPGQTTFWGSPYVSQLGQHLVLSHGVAIVVDDRFVGQVSLDFRVEELQRRAERWQGGQGTGQSNGQRVWIVNERQHILADSAEPLKVPSGKGLADTKVLVPLADRLPPGLNREDIDGSLFTPDAVRHGDGWVMVAALRIGAPWIYVQAVPTSALRALVLPTLLPNALLAAALLSMFVAGQWLLARYFVRPAMDVLDYLRRLSRDAAAVPPRLGSRWRGWVDAVTETYRLQAELQQRERRSELFKSTLVDHAPIAVVTADSRGAIVEFNPAAEQLFGIPRSAALGREAGEVTVPAQRLAAYRAAFDRFRAGESIQLDIDDHPIEATGRRADGSEFPMEVRAFRMRADDGEYYTCFITDLSARREAALQIERQRDALRQSEKLTAMGSLLASVAHELNNPLAIVVGRASLLEDKTVGSPLAADAKRIRDAAERCGRIVRTFLNIARQRPAQRSSVQLNDLVRAAAEMLGYTLRSHDIELALALAASLPEVPADADQLGQVVLNLIVNAQQALAGGGTRRRIEVRTGIDDGPGVAPRVWLRVADSGPGVPAAVREQIFDPFFTTKGEGVGTGLGLAVSRSIAREHGGDLVLDAPAVGDADALSGASFRLLLPVEGSGAPAPEIAERPAAAPAPPFARVLVVDDEPEIVRLVRTMLEGAGHAVVTADSGAAALAALGQQQPAPVDAIVCDLRMPDIDGAALWREVGTRHPALAARWLFVTGDTLSPGAGQFLAETGCAVLDKPFSKADLLARVQALLQQMQHGAADTKQG